MQKEYFTQTRTADFWVSEGIFYFVYKAGVRTETPEDAQENARVSKDIFAKFGHTRMPVLVDLSNLERIPRGNQKEYAELNKNLALAVAIIVKGFFPAVVGRVFLQVNEPENPTELFSSQKKGLVWLHEQTD